MTERLDLQEWPQAPDTIPDDLLNGSPSQDEIAPQGEGDGDEITPAQPRPRWQEKLGFGGPKPSAPRKSKPIPPKPRSGALVKPFTELYTTIGTMLVPFDQPCGMVIINNAEDCAKALDSLARENPAVRRALMALVETSVWGQVIAAHLPILLAVAMHHVPAVQRGMQGVPIVTMPQPRPDHG